MDYLAAATTRNPNVDGASSSSSTCASPATSISQIHQSTDKNNPPMGFTENNSLTYMATGNPCLDFFFHIVPDTPADGLIRRLELAWGFDPLTTLKLVCNLRGVRGTGKSDKEGWYTSALWLHKHHPKTLASNLRAFANFGYFKDLLEILYRLVEGSDVRKSAKEQWRIRKGVGKQRKRLLQHKKNLMKQNSSDANFKWQIDHIDELLTKMKGTVSVDKETASVLRREREIAKAKKASDKYLFDLSYRSLHDRVADLFAEILKMDIQCLNAGEPNKISLASKWCPSIDSSYDNATLIFKSIATRVFPKEPEYAGVDEENYVYKVRNRLRKEVLVPLHKALQLPEVYMSAQQWGVLPYTRVASVAMKNYKSIFTKHDKERFEGYLEDVKSGKAKIAAGALLPHQIIASLNEKDGEEVAELQWARTVDDLLKKGKLRNCMAICDVSGSMSGTPMEVCVALGLLVSELSEDPWKGKVITFSADPQLHEIVGDSLKSKTDFIRKMYWGGNTDFQKVFDQILNVAVREKLSQDQMIKRVFVFSDMEFDQASMPPPSSHQYPYNPYSCPYPGSYYPPSYHPYVPSAYSPYPGSYYPPSYHPYVPSAYSPYPGSYYPPSYQYSYCPSSYNPYFGSYPQSFEPQKTDGWETDYQVIQRKFKEHGYDKVPEIVFWNLRDSSSTPVKANQHGVALLSGFSKNLLTMFLDGDGIVNPVEVMQLAISGEEFKKLVVVD